MLTRIITGIFLVVLVLIPSLLFVDTLFVPILCSLLSVMAIFEMLRCLGKTRHFLTAIPTYIIAAAMPLIAHFEVFRDVFLPSCIVLVMVSVLYTLTLSVFRPEHYNSGETAQAFLLCTYIIAGATSVSIVSTLQNAKFVFPTIFIGSFVTDVFCYFSGMLFGKHKLIPRISPKKTVEGAIGGTLMCVAVFVLYGALVSRFTSLSANYLALALTGFVLAIVSQIGDLIASAVKRNYGIKDYGRLFPGHGGVIDRFDSLIAVALVLAIVGSQMQISLFI
ncbi:MAG: phosphatidate cytidylyltransferase [Clostridia bacterium]|nr:phosphatidate cytidylyltransferase [Clostridia bacterium]